MKKKILGFIGGIMMLCFVFMAKNAGALAKSGDDILQVTTTAIQKTGPKINGEDILDFSIRATQATKSYTDLNDTISTSAFTTLGEELESEQFRKNPDTWYKSSLLSAIEEENHAYEHILKSSPFLEHFNSLRRRNVIGTELRNCIKRILREQGTTPKENINLDNHINAILLNLNDRSVVLHVDEIKTLRDRLPKITALVEDEICKSILKIAEQRGDSIADKELAKQVRDSFINELYR